MLGQILSNRYLIAAEISMGGMGMVYRGTDLRTGGDVAIKVPHAFLVRNPEYMERLRREAQIAASIYSPRVVRVMDLDVHEGVPYIVMEYVPGETLADLEAGNRRFPLIDTLTVGIEVARALDAAFAKGVTHRDLKPQNIKIVDGEVKVLDFGISRAEGMDAVTSASVFMGTPEYCAPERAAGEGDIRADIYALGIIMFEMHEGRLPFQASAPMVMMRKHESEPPPPLTGEVPAEFQEIISRCLAKRPEDRYQTPRELVQAIRAVLDLPDTTLAQTLTPGDLPPTIRQPRETDHPADEDAADADALAVTKVAPRESPSGPAAAATVAGDRPVTGAAAADAAVDAEAASAAPAAPPVEAPVRPAPAGHPRRVMALAGVAAAVLLGGAVAAYFVSRDGNGGAVEPTATQIARNGPSSPQPSVAGNGSAPPRTASPAPSPQGPLLLTLGERKSLVGAGAVEITLGDACPGAKVLFQPTSIRMEAGGRVVLAFTVSAPRVTGVECIVDYPADAQCSCTVLQTRLASGRTVDARNTGGTGVSAAGANDIYGAAPVAGEWWWDRGVELDGEELTLIRLGPGSEVPLFRLPILRRGPS